MTKFNLKHVYESQQFDLELLDIIFNMADEMKQDLFARQRQYADVLKNKIMASLFYEPSTRTRFSFESAMARLGGSILTTENAKEFSSASKGETLYDSTSVMCGYADLIVMRHNEPGSAKMAAEVSSVPVINAGDGSGQHPTQALLDLYTIKDNFSTIDGLTFAMVGDLKYGRTVRSLSYLLTKYDHIKIYYVSPLVCKMDEDIKDYLTKYKVEWEEVDSLEKVLPLVDCVYMTRIQKERFHNLKDYESAAGKYILDKENIRLMKQKSIIMHPLPRVDEIAQEVDNDPRAQYFNQAKNGLYIRMALLYLLLG
ncbi:MAG: aspartate carbamoyltransferase [Deltaproteobacteria bacterium]|nr:MAG: aspartate carbamoyltransferase [Deltaproteobacteria bacterium]